MEHKDIILKERNGVKYYVSKSLENMGFIKHFFSTRIGGVSKVSYDSLNLGIYTQDDKENIYKNYSRIFGAEGMNKEKFVYLRQVHGNDFYHVNEDNWSSIIARDGDALITTSRNIPIGVMTADCIPIIIVDSSKKFAAAVHAGWKGTHLRIVEKIVNYAVDNLGSRVENINAVIGPGIGPCCFEVKEDVACKFFFVERRNDIYYVDLWKENIKQLSEMGVKSIIHEPLCTKCNGEKFYSYRRDGVNTGRMAAFVEIL